MWQTTAGTNISVLEFWRRRIVRVVPLYWIFLFVVVILALSAPKLFNSTVITPENTIKSFLLIPHLHAVQNLIAPILIPGWSLNYEMFFYFLFGLALFVPSRPQRAILLGTLLLGVDLAGACHLSTDRRCGGNIYEFRTSEIPQWNSLGDYLSVYRIYNNHIGSASIRRSALALHFRLKWFCRVRQLRGPLARAHRRRLLALEPAVRRAPSLVFHVIGNASYSIYLSHLFFLRLPEIWGMGRALWALRLGWCLGRDIRHICAGLCHCREESGLLLHRASNPIPISDAAPGIRPIPRDQMSRAVRRSGPCARPLGRDRVIAFSVIGRNRITSGHSAYECRNCASAGPGKGVSARANRATSRPAARAARQN